MSIADYEKAKKRIRNSDEADFEGRKSEGLIAAAEKVLNLRFPPTYRAFLKDFGCGDIAGFEVYGVISDDFENSGIPDAVWITLKMRKSDGLPLSMVLIAESDEGYYAIDCARDSANDEHPVIEYAPGGGSVPVADDFGCFLLQQIEDME